MHTHLKILAFHSLVLISFYFQDTWDTGLSYQLHTPVPIHFPGAIKEERLLIATNYLTKF